MNMHVGQCMFDSVVGQTHLAGAAREMFMGDSLDRLNDRFIRQDLHRGEVIEASKALIRRLFYKQQLTRLIQARECDRMIGWNLFLLFTNGVLRRVFSF